jgi:hypothetical protein
MEKPILTGPPVAFLAWPPPLPFPPVLPALLSAGPLTHPAMNNAVMNMRVNNALLFRIFASFLFEHYPKIFFND